MQKRSEHNLVLMDKGLQDLNFLRSIEWEGLFEVNMNKNYLSSIEQLNKFRNLKAISASNNYIYEVHLELGRLESLDLTNNYLSEVPNLTGTPKLMELNLTSN